MREKLSELRRRLQEVNDLTSAGSILGWDQTTYMPPGGIEARGRTMALLARLSHERFIDPAVGRLLDDLAPYAESLPFDSFEASLVRVTRREYDRAIRVPPAFLAEFNEHTTTSYQVWTQAKPANDFQRVRPHLEKTLDFSRRLADFFPGYEHIADPLIDNADYGMKASTVRRLFDELREGIVPLAEAIAKQPPADDSCLRGSFPADEQTAFGLDVIAEFGFDFDRGRQDRSPHPFATRFSSGDVRITTRVDEENLAECLFSTLHESGHAMYELGVDPALEGTPLAHGTSSGVHESQSRLWENLVGRSRGFWEHYYPHLQSRFPTQLGKVSLDTFYRAVNRVARSLIRTEADEVTYNLHVIVRFGLELDLLEGKVPVARLPEEWRARYEETVGIAPPDDRRGVLQDVHWYMGPIGGVFQGYTLGNILGAQFYAKAVSERPSIPQDIRAGRFEALHGWLREKIYTHGSKFTPDELVERVIGGGIRVEPYLEYLRAKYGELYPL